MSYGNSNKKNKRRNKNLIYGKKIEFCIEKDKFFEQIDSGVDSVSNLLNSDNNNTLESIHKDIEIIIDNIFSKNIGQNILVRFDRRIPKEIEVICITGVNWKVNLREYIASLIMGGISSL